MQWTLRSDLCVVVVVVIYFPSNRTILSHVHVEFVKKIYIKQMQSTAM